MPAPEELSFPEGQSDQYRHEGAEGAEADDVSKNDHKQHTERDQKHCATDSLGLGRQSQQRKIQEKGLFCYALFSGNCCPLSVGDKIFINDRITVGRARNLQHRLDWFSCGVKKVK